MTKPEKTSWPRFILKSVSVLLWLFVSWIVIAVFMFWYVFIPIPGTPIEDQELVAIFHVHQRDMEQVIQIMKTTEEFDREFLEKRGEPPPYYLSPFKAEYFDEMALREPTLRRPLSALKQAGLREISSGDCFTFSFDGLVDWEEKPSVNSLYIKKLYYCRQTPNSYIFQNAVFVGDTNAYIRAKGTRATERQEVMHPIEGDWYIWLRWIAP